MTSQLKKVTSIILISLILASAYFIREIFLPFILASFIAYIMHPASNFLSKFIRSRSLVAISIILLLIIIVILLILIFLPKLYSELNHLIEKISNYNHLLNQQVIKDKYNNIDPSIILKLQEILSNASGSIFKYLINSIYDLWSTSIAFFNFLSLVFLAPIICFYFIRDYKKIFDSIEKLANAIMSTDAKMLLTEKIYQLNVILQSYIKAQINVSLIFICYYSIALKSLNIDSAFTIGIVSGILIIIPYLGFIISLLIAASICLLQFADISKLAIVFIVYLMGQIIESNFVTPKLIGDKMDLHPVWIIFAVLVFNNIFGIIGAIIAIPLAAIIQFLIKEFFVYKISSKTLKPKKISS